MCKNKQFHIIQHEYLLFFSPLRLTSTSPSAIRLSVTFSAVLSFPKKTIPNSLPVPGATYSLVCVISFPINFFRKYSLASHAKGWSTEQVITFQCFNPIFCQVTHKLANKSDLFQCIPTSSLGSGNPSVGCVGRLANFGACTFVSPIVFSGGGPPLG